MRDRTLDPLHDHIAEFTSGLLVLTITSWISSDVAPRRPSLDPHGSPPIAPARPNGIKFTSCPAEEQEVTSPGFLPSVRSLPRQRRAGLIQPTSQMQAIRDRSGQAIGYELFYRDSPTADSASERTTAATLSVLAGLMAAGQGDAAHAAHCYFVNVTRDIVVNNGPLPDPSTVAVLEVQPEVLADAPVLAGAERLRALGYGFALERYVPGQSNGHDDLLRFASHVKLALDGADRRTLETAVRRVRAASNALIIGCRIGSPAAHDLAREIGCDLFQGFALDGDDRQLQQSVRGP